MNLEDTYRLLVGGYFGVSEMDEYSSKEYVLKDIEDYIDNFNKSYPLPNFNYQEEKDKVEKIDLVRKLQDAIIVLNIIDGPLELKLLIQRKLKELGV